ncbi:MAG: hypothetical protein RSB03_02580, partial [Oscillospiraceae bacterium]
LIIGSIIYIKEISHRNIQTAFIGRFLCCHHILLTIPQSVFPMLIALLPDKRCSEQLISLHTTRTIAIMSGQRPNNSGFEWLIKLVFELDTNIAARIPALH